MNATSIEHEASTWYESQPMRRSALASRDKRPLLPPPYRGDVAWSLITLAPEHRGEGLPKLDFSRYHYIAVPLHRHSTK